MTARREARSEMITFPYAERGAIVDRPAFDTSLWRSFDTIFEDFRRSFDDLLAPWLPMRTWMRSGTAFPVRAPLVDLIDKGDKYILRAELPGYTKDMVNVELNKDTLTIKAEKKTEEEERAENYLHRERAYSACQRTINFPEEVDPSKAEGTMNNGVLELQIPKKAPKPEEQMRKVELK